MKIKNKKKYLIDWRFYFLVFAIIFLFLCLLVRSFFVQVISSDHLSREQDLRSLRSVAAKSERGFIFDRNGEVLAASSSLRTIWIDPMQVELQQDADSFILWQSLADILSINKDQLLAKIKSKQEQGKRFIYLKRQVSTGIANAIKDLGLAGIHVQKESKRFYPEGEVLSTVIGFTGLDNVGIEGLEKLYNNTLSSYASLHKVRKSRDGLVVKYIDHPVQVKAVDDVYLSIDQRLQNIAYLELKKSAAKFRAKSSSVVIINPNTGEVLALANTPSYNPNKALPKNHYNMLNHAVTDAFESGSVIKPLVAAIALENKYIKKDIKISTYPGYLKDDKGNIIAKDPRHYGSLSISDILRKSSNVGISKVATKVPPSVMYNWFVKFGLGSKTSLQLSGESTGLMNYKQISRNKRSYAAFSFGYGFSATLMQLMNIYCVIANDGYQVPFTLTKLTKKPVYNKLISSDTAKYIRESLVDVVERGTARRARIKGYVVAGKTGTARKATAGGYGDQYVNVFIGMAPADNPKLVVGVLINEPQGDLYHSGEVAAPVFSSILSASLSILNIESNSVISSD